MEEAGGNRTHSSSVKIPATGAAIRRETISTASIDIFN